MKLVDLYEFVDPEQKFSIYDMNNLLFDCGLMRELDTVTLKADIYSVSVEPDMDDTIKIQLQL